MKKLSLEAEDIVKLNTICQQTFKFLQDKIVENFPGVSNRNWINYEVALVKGMASTHIRSLAHINDEPILNVMGKYLSDIENVANSVSIRKPGETISDGVNRILKERNKCQ